MVATYDDLSRDIDRIARSVAADYPDIDWQDIRQELSVFVLQHGKSIKLKHEGGNPHWLLNRVAQGYCKQLRSEHLTLSVQYAYRPSEVKFILDNAFFGPDSTSFVPDDARNPLSKTFTTFDPAGNYRTQDVDPFHVPDAMEVASDVKAAIQRLKPELKEAIFRRYVLNKVPGNDSYERKKLNRAINELTYTLNTYRGNGPNDKKMRKARSNAGSRAQISEVYEG